jgi:hypothetical protein
MLFSSPVKFSTDLELKPAIQQPSGFLQKIHITVLTTYWVLPIPLSEIYKEHTSSNLEREIPGQEYCNTKTCHSMLRLQLQHASQKWKIV